MDDAEALIDLAKQYDIPWNQAIKRGILMNCVFYSNGIIIQGVNNIPDNYSSDDIFPFGYYGIERYVTYYWSMRRTVLP